MSKEFTTKDVGEHNTVDKGLYVIIDSNVYEMGGFVGGAKILKRVGGKDATKQFWKVSKPSLPDLVDGNLSITGSSSVALTIYHIVPQ